MIYATETYINDAKDALRAWGAEERRQLQIEIVEHRATLNPGPHATIEHELMRYAGARPRGAGMRIEAERPDIIAIDRIVSQLHGAGGGDALRRALYYHYVLRLSWRAHGRAIGKSPRHCRDLVERGQSWVASALANRGDAY